MAWDASASTSDVLNLSGTFQTVQESTADLELTLTPQETLHIQFEYDPQSSPTEDALVIVETSLDGTNWDTDENPFAAVVLDNAEDPARASLLITGPYQVRFRAKLLDTDGTDGGDDTATLTARYRTDGVSAT